MKKIAFFLGVSLTTASVLPAQTGDTIIQRRDVIIVDEIPEMKVTEKENNHWSDSREQSGLWKRNDHSVNYGTQVGLGYNGLVQNLSKLKLSQRDEWMELDAKSINFNLRIIEYTYHLSGHFRFRTGVDLEVANFRFRRNMIPALSGSGKEVIESPVVDYPLKKSKLVNSYFNVPLTIQWGIGNRNQCVLYGGVVGGWRWNSYVKEKSAEHGKIRHRDDLNLRNFHYGYTVGAQFHKVGFYATYYPQSIFKANLGPDVRQVSIGIQLMQ
jgi:hypothetical protein